MTDRGQPDANDADPPQFREERIAIGELSEASRERFALLHQVGKKVLSASSLDDLNQLALSLVFECVNAERGALLLRDPESGEFVPRVLRHRDRGPLGADEFRVPRSIVREVVSGKLGILTSDAIHDPRFESRASVRGANIRSALCAPLWDEENVLGVVYLDSRVQSYAFTREDLVLLNAIANLVAIRLKQESLYSQLTRERIVRSNLARYHSPEVVEAILAGAKDPDHPDGGLEERDVTILFADLRGFTQLAENASPSIVAEFLNEYYKVATRVVFEHRGTVLEYIGDSAMAVFGAPIPQKDHAFCAVNAGLDLLRQMRLSRGDLLERFGSEVRVAINSGTVVVGSIGTPDRLSYTVIGDAVNVASRLEGIGATNAITLGEQTFRLLGGKFSCQDLGPQKLRGREVPVHVYRIQA